jgi:putative phosphoesterase
MRVGIISDTHDNKDNVLKALQIFKNEGVKILFHLGDFIAPFTLKLFEGFNLYAVFGNNDGEKLLLKKVAEDYGFVLEDGPLEVELFNKNFLLFHGWGSVEKTRKIAESLAKSRDYDFVLYGHTHKRDFRRFGKTLLINPGEACGYLGNTPTIFVLDVKAGDGKFLYL